VRVRRALLVTSAAIPALLGARRQATAYHDGWLDGAEIALRLVLGEKVYGGIDPMPGPLSPEQRRWVVAALEAVEEEK
jgi:hypothetical protein